MSAQEALVSLKAINGHLELFPDHLVVLKRGFFAYVGTAFEGKRLEIKLSSIKSFKLIRSQFIVNGLLIINFGDEGKQHILLVYSARNQPQAIRVAENLEDYLSRSAVYPFIKEQFLKQE